MPAPVEPARRVSDLRIARGFHPPSAGTSAAATRKIAGSRLVLGAQTVAVKMAQAVADPAPAP